MRAVCWSARVSFVALLVAPSAVSSVAVLDSSVAAAAIQTKAVACARLAASDSFAETGT